MTTQFTTEMLPPPHLSWNKILATLHEDARGEIISTLTDDEAIDASSDWFLQARREQMPPLWDWFIWVVMAGRGWGKNWTGSNWLVNEHVSKRAKNSGIVAATSADLRRFCINGPSGILSLAPSWFRPEYKPATSMLVWPDGAVTSLFTSEIPDRLRGPNLDKVWCDELAAWRYLDDTWEMLQLALRYGNAPQCVVTTTPRPRKVLKTLMKRIRSAELPSGDVALTSGSTYDNKDNLPARFVNEIIAQYKGTRLERQEIFGELLPEFEGALWSYKLLDECRIPEHPTLGRIGIGVDPAITSEEGSDLTGIIVAGLGPDKHGYVLGDHSLRASPEGWARKVVTLYHKEKADIIVAEKNQGGDMVEATIRAVDDSVNVKLVHASRAKITRAEPIAAFYEQHRIHHVGTFPDLEDEMTLFLPGRIKKEPRSNGWPCLDTYRINGRVESRPAKNQIFMTPEFPSKPELLKMRWVCGLCLNVIEAPLYIEWLWRLDHVETGIGKGRWEPSSLQEPICHGRAMLVAGKPKLDIHGSGLMVDPVDNLRCPKIELSQ